MTHRFRFSCPRLALSLVCGLVLGSFVGCEQEEPIEARLCQRLDACNYFGPGVSVDDCTDVMTMCSDSVVTSVRTDWTDATEDALDMANCTNFLVAYETIGVCSILGDGSIDDEPAPGGGGGGGGGGGDGPAPGDDGSGEGETGHTGEECTGDAITCVGPATIEVCDGGAIVSIDCQTLCVDQGFAGADDCSFDAQSGHDVCWCVEGPTPPPQ